MGEAITRVSLGNDIDEDDLLKELEDMEQEQLDNKMVGAPVAPVTQVGNGPGEYFGYFKLLDTWEWVLTKIYFQKKAKLWRIRRKRRMTRRKNSGNCKPRC